MKKSEVIFLDMIESEKARIIELMSGLSDDDGLQRAVIFNQVRDIQQQIFVYEKEYNKIIGRK